MIPGARLILLGRQGAGKGTQCVRLSRHFVVPHISTGDMLRAAVREGTDLGRMAKKVMDDGGLVGDDIMIGIVDERLSHHDARRPRVHPRRLPAHGGPGPASIGITAERRSTSCSISTCPVSSCSQRLSARRVCRDCGTNYVGQRVREAAVDLRGLRRRRHASRRRHAGRDRASTRPLRGADLAADRVLPEPRSARGRRRCRFAGGGVLRLVAARRPPSALSAIDEAVARRSAERAARTCAPPAASWPRCTKRFGLPLGPGVTTADLDRVAPRRARSPRRARRTSSATTGIPAVICASVNDELVHGIPDGRRAREGDIVVDRLRSHRQRLARRRRVHDGRRRDRRRARTTDRRRRSGPGRGDRGDGAGRSSRRRRCGGRVAVVTAAGYGSPRDYCGHGIGRAMHEEPDVENRGRRARARGSSPASSWRSSRC